MIDWLELVLALKRTTGYTWPRLASAAGVNRCVVEDMAKGNVKSPRFDNGFALLCYAREVKADVSRAIKI